MDNHFFRDAGIPLDHPTPPTWHPINTPTSDLHFPPPAAQSSDHFLHPTTNESFVLRELIGKLGSICNSGEIARKTNIQNSGNSILVPSIGSDLPVGDPGFVERAARFSSFGSRSFNGRSTQLPSAIGGSESSTRFAGGPRLQRVSSSPAINGPGSRKRKSPATEKYRGIPCSSPSKAVENGDDPNAKRCVLNEQEIEEEDGDSKKQKTCEGQKDYIHVRARRGQATDSHSLAERVRREKISERMKLLQDLVPGCNKVTGKALMLEEIINYVQSLQKQVEFLSMKLANVNPSPETDFQNEAFEPNCCVENLMGPSNERHDMQLSNINGFNNGVSELCEGDLHTVVQMATLHFLQGSNQAMSMSMKTEF